MLIQLLYADDPLATGFPITMGRAEITVPSVTTRNSYILVLFGDSGNASPRFTINNLSITASPPSTVASGSSSSGSASATDTQPSVFSDGSSTSLASQAISSTANQTISGSAVVTSAQVSSASSFSISSATSSASATQPQPAAAQSSTATNSGIRGASYGGAVTWLSSICSLALVLGFAL